MTGNSGSHMVKRSFAPSGNDLGSVIAAMLPPPTLFLMLARGLACFPVTFLGSGNIVFCALSLMGKE